MIDLTARPHAALLLRRLASGRITNDDFDGEYPDHSADPGVRAVWQFGWSLYSDFTTYRLVGRRALLPEHRRLVARCVLFLHSGLPYEYALFPPPRFLKGLRQVLTIGVWSSGQREAKSAWRASVDWNVWPFRGQHDLSAAASSPRFLTAASREAPR